MQRLAPAAMSSQLRAHSSSVSRQRCRPLTSCMRSSSCPAIALAIMAVVSIGLGWLVAGRALSPIREMTSNARHISAENLHERLGVQGPTDELKDLGDTIDDLLARLETAFEAQKRFVANASHELRTPLTMMRTSVDVAVGKAQPPAEVRVLAGKVGEGLDEADRILEGLLLLARAQRGALGDLTAISLPDTRGHLRSQPTKQRSRERASLSKTSFSLQR